jgi:hypothetical protein
MRGEVKELGRFAMQDFDRDTDGIGIQQHRAENCALGIFAVGWDTIERRVGLAFRSQWTPPKNTQGPLRNVPKHPPRRQNVHCVINAINATRDGAASMERICRDIVHALWKDSVRRKELGRA